MRISSLHDDGVEPPAEWIEWINSPERAAAMRASGQATDTSPIPPIPNRGESEMRIDDQMNPLRIRMAREANGGDLPPELRQSVEDAEAAESTMSPMQIRIFRESHGGKSPTELAQRGGAR